MARHAVEQKCLADRIKFILRDKPIALISGIEVKLSYYFDTLNVELNDELSTREIQLATFDEHGETLIYTQFSTNYALEGDFALRESIRTAQDIADRSTVRANSIVLTHLFNSLVHHINKCEPVRYISSVAVNAADGLIVVDYRTCFRNVPLASVVKDNKIDLIKFKEELQWPATWSR
jgi:hypothetical protein